jgi:phospholipase C
VVNHSTLDYTSALRFIEQNWGLQPLTSRDRSATSLASALDFGTPPRQAQIIPADTVAAPMRQVRVNPIYWFYGIAFALAIALFLNATFGPAVRARLPRPPMPMRLVRGKEGSA